MNKNMEKALQPFHTEPEKAFFFLPHHPHQILRRQWQVFGPDNANDKRSSSKALGEDL
jgi:hypothetical protein